MKTASRPKRVSKSSSKKLTAIQTSRHLRVSHRKHSGHVLPRHQTSYPVLLMIVLCVGVLLTSWTRYVAAGVPGDPGPKQGTYDVHLRVPGPPPTIPATISAPGANAVFTEEPITVTGSCPTDTYVSLSRNGVFSGVGICKIDGTYSIKTGLFVGLNKLEVQVYSRTDVAGPPTDPITVTYKPPVPPPGQTPPSSTPPATAGGGTTSKPQTGTAPTPQTAQTPQAAKTAPLLLKSTFTYQGVYTGEPTDWQLAIDGGTEPYAISVDWGDGTTSVISRAHAGGFNLQHQYKQAGKYKGSYTATFMASDADGNKAYLQLITVVNDPPVIGGAVTKGDDSGFSVDTSPAYLQQILRYVWPGYGVVLLMLLSFWLGERRELQVIRSHQPKHRRRHA